MRRSRKAFPVQALLVGEKRDERLGGAPVPHEGQGKGRGRQNALVLLRGDERDQRFHGARIAESPQGLHRPHPGPIVGILQSGQKRADRAAVTDATQRLCRPRAYQIILVAENADQWRYRSGGLGYSQCSHRLSANLRIPVGERSDQLIYGVLATVAQQARCG